MPKTLRTGFFVTRFIYEPHHEKTCFLHMQTKDNNCAADQHLCFRYIDRTIPLLPKSEISSLQRSSEAAQPGLCRTLSETPKTGFLATRLIFS